MYHLHNLQIPDEKQIKAKQQQQKPRQQNQLQNLNLSQTEKMGKHTAKQKQVWLNLKWSWEGSKRL